MSGGGADIEEGKPKPSRSRTPFGNALTGNSVSRLLSPAGRETEFPEAGSQTEFGNQGAVPSSLSATHGIAAFGVVEAGPEELAALRRAPGGLDGAPLPSNFHRHSDDQSVAGLEAVLRAVHSGGLDGRSLEGWGVVAAPRFPGRRPMALALARFETESPAFTSPFLVTHHLLHSVAGTVSVALRLRGPCVGAGGGADLGEGLLAALSVLDEGRVPGLWVVFSAWDPEPTDEMPAAAVCRAVALAVLPHAAGTGLRLTRRTDAPPAAAAGDLASLAAVLGRRGAGGRWVCPLDCGGWAELAEAA